MKRDELEIQILIEVILKILIDKRVLTLHALKEYMDRSLLRLEKSGVLANEDARAAHDQIEMRLISMSAAQRRESKPRATRTAKRKKGRRTRR